MTDVNRRELFGKLTIFGIVPFAGCSYSGSESVNTENNTTTAEELNTNTPGPTASDKQKEISPTHTHTEQRGDSGVDIRISNFSEDEVQATISIYNIVNSSENEFIFEDTFTISDEGYTTFSDVFVVDENESKDYSISINFDDNREESFSISFSRTPDATLVGIQIFEDRIEYSTILP